MQTFLRVVIPEPQIPPDTVYKKELIAAPWETRRIEEWGWFLAQVSTAR